MKKLILSCLAFLSLGAATAQDVHWGIKGGFNAAMLRNSAGNETELKPGFHAGGLAHIHLIDNFALQPELFYSAQGGKTISNNNETNTNLHYLNLPVLAQYMFNNGFRIQAGPQIGLLLKARQEVNDNNESNVIQYYRTTDFSLPVGVSYVGRSGLGIDVRWAFGISNINDVGNRKPEVQNSVGQIGLFYLLHQGH
ncbi:MAG: hypothetical protein COW65_11365 [Cytophagales bacterium CG18_big_fil_WC_8_21_14_2_50_42_9]|nr:MAG: hypothetical protein COW65_11365 [Cytophagales bacterium CG18_big_fil_WC_8_21_14_2_50_42_9]